MHKRFAQGFRLGNWTVYPRAGRLTKGWLRKTERRVEPKAIQVLNHLAENQGQFRSKDEILSSVWKGRAVGDDCLTGAIHALRHALGDDPRNPVYIETRNSVGYRLIAPVRDRISKVSISIAALASIVVCSLLVWQILPDETLPIADAGEQRIAVLPFTNLSGSENDEYFAAAMMDALISDLAKRPGIRVISSTSTTKFSDHDGSASQIASELGADLLVEGSVQTSNGRARVGARLIDAVEDGQIWAEQFDRDAGDLFQLQREISSSIAAQIGLVTGALDAPLLDDLNARELQQHMEARYFLAKQSESDASRALELFTELTLARPDFADAHLGRAEALLSLFKSGGYEKGILETAALAATEFESLAGPSAASHRCVGQIRLLLDWDFETAENRYLSALSINPSDVVTRRRYAWLLVAKGQYEQAKTQIAHTRKLDPLYYHNPGLAVLLHYAGDPGGAIREFERVDAMSGLNKVSLRVLAIAYISLDRQAEARTTLMRILRESGDTRMVASQDFGDMELPDLYRRILQERNYRSSIISASYRTLLGDVDQALADLEQAFAVRDPFIPYIDAMPEFAVLHDHPRFQAILRGLGNVSKSQQLSLAPNISASNLINTQQPNKEPTSTVQRN